MRRLTIRAKITLWFASMLLPLLGGFSLFIYVSMSKIMYQGMKELIKAHTAQVISSVEVENGNISNNELHELKTTGTSITLYDIKNRLIAGSRLYPQITNLSPDFNKIRNIEINEENFLVYDQAVYEDNRIIAWVRAVRSLNPVKETLDILKMMILFAVPAGIVITVLGGLVLAKKALTPIDHITRTAEAIGQGDLTQRLNLPEVKDEVGRLVKVFDDMLVKLESSFKRERQFTSDASHELRTPIAVISAQSEEALAGNRTLKEYREALQTILKESRKMGVIVAQLLNLTRGDENKYRTEIENIDIGVIAEEVIDEMRGIAEKNRIKLVFQGEKSIKMRADQTLITRLIINLIDNGIKYNREDGRVTVGLHKEGEFARITVEDSGAGIPPEHLNHVFDRFFRVNRARSGDGTGLGLSIVKWIIDVHNGSVEVKSTPGEGSIFTVLLPIKIKKS